jgi:hypothetical protein
MDLYQETKDALSVAEQCYPILAGHGPTIQGAALCELVARHLAGHVVLGDAAATAEMRRNLLAAFIQTVEALVPVVDESVIQPELNRRTQ